MWSTLDEGDHKNSLVRRPAKDKIPLFGIRVIRICHQEGEWVSEHRGRLVEGDTVLPSVQIRFPGIPFEEIAHDGSSYLLILGEPETAERIWGQRCQSHGASCYANGPISGAIELRKSQGA